MTPRRSLSQRFSLWRWSRRKLEAKSAQLPTPPAPATGAVAAAPFELPSVESLTFESDFAAFLRPEVDDQVKRAALKQLFRDPRFNIMDGLDTYIDDYTQADPIATDVVADLLQRGFDHTAEAGPEPRVVAPAPCVGPAPTTGSPSEGNAGPASTLTPELGDPSSEREGASTQQQAGDAPRSRAEDDEYLKRTNPRQ
jgi:hypothetical protein